MCRYLRYTLLLLAVLSFGLVFYAPAVYAQDDPDTSADNKEPAGDDDDEDDEEEQAAKHFTKGRQLYKEGKHKEAIEELLAAYRFRPAPPILLNIARTYEKLGDKRNALKYYKEFLLKARFADPNRKMVQAVVKKLERQVTGRTGAVTSAAGTDTPTAMTTEESDGSLIPRRRQQMIHTPVDSAKVREPITIMAELPPGLEAERVVVNFRKGGETTFRQLPMELQGEAYIARIPARFVTSTSLQYFVSAEKGKGKQAILAEAGNKHTPHIVVIEGGRSPNLGPVTDEEIRSPYRTWFWVSSAAAVALLGVGVSGFVLSADRESAIERWAVEQSCVDNCTGIPKRGFEDRARDWESQGKTFNALGWVGVTVGTAAAATAGFLWYLDRKHVKQERAKWNASSDEGPEIRFAASPWVDATGAGCLGQIQF